MTGYLEVWHLNGAGNRPYARRIFRGKNGYYARQRSRSVDANGLDLGVSVWRAGEGAMKHTRRLEVVGVVADALDKPRVFLTLEFLAEPANVAVALASVTRCAVRFSVTRHRSPRSRARCDWLGHFARGVSDGCNNVLVAGAPAYIAAESLANVGVRRVGLAIKEVMRAHDHAGGTEAALQAVLLPEPVLKGMQLVTCGQTLYGSDAATVGLNRQYGTGFDGTAVHQHGTSAA